jgi:hypothetical protein
VTQVAIKAEPRHRLVVRGPGPQPAPGVARSPDGDDGLLVLGAPALEQQPLGPDRFGVARLLLAAICDRFAQGRAQ